MSRRNETVSLGRMILLSLFPSQSIFLLYSIASNQIEIVSRYPDNKGFDASVFCGRASEGTKEGARGVVEMVLEGVKLLAYL